MIAKDAILLNLYTCKGRNYRCECDDCVSLCISVPKKIDWKLLTYLNGNIKGGKSFIRRELPKYSNDKKLITKFKKQEEELLSIKKEELLKSAEEEKEKQKKKEIYYRKFNEWKNKMKEEILRKAKNDEFYEKRQKGDWSEIHKDPKFIALAQFHTKKVALDRRVEELTKGLPHIPIEVKCYFTPVGEEDNLDKYVPLITN